MQTQRHRRSKRCSRPEETTPSNIRLHYDFLGFTLSVLSCHHQLGIWPLLLTAKATPAATFHRCPTFVHLSPLFTSLNDDDGLILQFLQSVFVGFWGCVDSRYSGSLPRVLMQSCRLLSMTESAPGRERTTLRGRTMECSAITSACFCRCCGLPPWPASLRASRSSLSLAPIPTYTHIKLSTLAQ